MEGVTDHEMSMKIICHMRKVGKDLEYIWDVIDKDKKQITGIK